MPHVLTTILTQVAVALVEAALLRLLARLWKAFGTRGATAAHA